MAPMLATLATRPTAAAPAAPAAAAKRGPEFDSHLSRPAKRAKSEAPSCRHTCKDCKCKGFPECYNTYEDGQTECCMRCRDGGSGEHREWNAKAQQWETVYDESDDETDDETEEEEEEEEEATEPCQSIVELEGRRVPTGDTIFEATVLRVAQKSLELLDQLEAMEAELAELESRAEPQPSVLPTRPLREALQSLVKPFVPKGRPMSKAMAAELDKFEAEDDIPVTEPVRRVASQVIVVPDDDKEVIVVPDDDNEVIVVE